MDIYQMGVRFGQQFLADGQVGGTRLARYGDDPPERLELTKSLMLHFPRAPGPPPDKMVMVGLGGLTT